MSASGKEGKPIVLPLHFLKRHRKDLNKVCLIEGILPQTYSPTFPTHPKLIVVLYASEEFEALSFS